MNVPLKVIATRIDKNRGNVCVSRRAVLEKSKNAEITKALKNIKEIMYPGQNKFNRYKKNFNKEIKITDDIKKDIEKLLN